MRLICQLADNTEPNILSPSQAQVWLRLQFLFRAEPKPGSDPSFYSQPSQILAQILHLKPSRARAQLESANFLELSQAIRASNLSLTKNRRQKKPSQKNYWEGNFKTIEFIIHNKFLYFGFGFIPTPTIKTDDISKYFQQ